MNCLLLVQFRTEIYRNRPNVKTYQPQDNSVPSKEIDACISETKIVVINTHLILN